MHDVNLHSALSSMYFLDIPREKFVENHCLRCQYILMKKEPSSCVNHLVIKIKDYVIEAFNEIEKIDLSLIDAKFQQYFDRLEEIEKF